MKDFFDLLQSRDPDVRKLHPDLQPYVQETVMGQALRSPFVYQVPLHNVEFATKLYEQNKARFDGLVLDEEYLSAIYLVERPYRMVFLHDWWTSDMLTIEQLRELLPPAWTDTEFPHQYAGMPRELFRAAATQGILTDTGAPLDDVLTVYRGCRKIDDEISWTLDRDKAIWFAQRLANEGDTQYVQRGEISHTKVWAHFEGRGESEIVLDPKRLYNRAVHQVRKDGTLIKLQDL
jgi:hypothetical protein